MASQKHATPARQDAPSARPDAPAAPERNFARNAGVTLLGVYLIGLTVTLFFLMVRFWPAAPPAPVSVPPTDTLRVQQADTTARPATFVRRAGTAAPILTRAVPPQAAEPASPPSPWNDPEVRLILLVLFAGAFGSFLHAANSFIYHVGNKTFSASWTWWYVMRPFIGAFLALIVYFAVRGGLLSISVGGSNDGETIFERLNVFGVVGLSGLVGMFSRQASDKLGEVFDTLFRTQQTPPPYPKPILNRLEPDQAPAGSEGLVLTVHGKHFVEGKTVVRVNGIARKTEFIAPDQLLVHLSADDLAHAGRLNVTVETPQPGGGIAGPLTFEVVPAGGEAPPTDAPPSDEAPAEEEPPDGPLPPAAPPEEKPS